MMHTIPNSLTIFVPILIKRQLILLPSWFRSSMIVFFTIIATVRACVLDFQGSWVEHLPLIEFAYNNSFQSSIRMAPYEALMEGHVDRLCAGLNQERLLCLVQSWYRKRQRR